VVKVFYDDERSLLDKLRLYRAREVDSVSFWRIGQGPPGLWGSIGSIGPGQEPPAGGPAR
jgi:spore germination protein YaaH